MDTKTQHGYLVMADISGFTSFVATTELAHAHDILTELLELLVARMTTLLTLSQVEGDCVFAFISEEKLPRSETLIELIESTYVAFKDHVEGIRRRTTCQCHACRSIPMLDLKFMVHYGEYAVRSVRATPELLGSDINLIHRLLKNHVAETTGWRAYVLLTRKCLEHMSAQLDGLVDQSETYEHLGEIKTCVVNLQPRYQALIDQRRIVVEPDQAQLTFVQACAAPPPVVWDWLNEPSRRAKCGFQDGLIFVAIIRPGGRTGVGARNHCLHGKDVAMVEDILDWRPFDYFTIVQKFKGCAAYMTYQLEPLLDGQGTQLHVYLNGTTPVPRFLNPLAFRWLFTRVFPMAKLYQRAAGFMAEEMAQRSGAHAG